MIKLLVSKYYCGFENIFELLYWLHYVFTKPYQQRHIATQNIKGIMGIIVFYFKWITICNTVMLLSKKRKVKMVIMSIPATRRNCFVHQWLMVPIPWLDAVAPLSCYLPCLAFNSSIYTRLKQIRYQSSSSSVILSFILFMLGKRETSMKYPTQTSAIKW